MLFCLLRLYLEDNVFFYAITTVRLDKLYKFLILCKKLEEVTVFLSIRNSHWGVNIWAKPQMIKGRNLRGNSRVPDQLPMIKISSVIKNIYPPSNQYPVLQLKNPCCHGNCKRSQLWHGKAITETSLLWNDQQSRVLYKKCLMSIWTWKQNAASNLTSKASFHKYLPNFH